jgi:hypothetical protein
MRIYTEELIPTYLHWYIPKCKLLHRVAADTRNREVHILCKLHVTLCKVRAKCTVLFKLQYILMHWTIMHKICKTKYTELSTECSPDGCSTTLRTELSTYVEGRC